VERATQLEVTVRARRPWAPVPQNSNEENGGFRAIVPVSAGGSLPREVPTPPLENPWDRYDPGDGYA